MIETTRETYDVVVIGCGVAGLAAALSCAEAARDVNKRPVRIAVLERATRQERGGNSRWTAAYLRLQDEYTPAEHFVEDMEQFSGGKSDAAYVETLVKNIPETMDWLQSKGLRLQRLPTIFITKAKPRLLPVGGGERIVETLATHAESMGVRILYETTALRIHTNAEGAVAGVVVRGTDGHLTVIEAGAVIIASGGFEGNPEMMTQYLGQNAYVLPTIARGGQYNKGEGIRMALELGAKPSGQWDNFHAEPIDPRSSQPQAVVMVFPYGILVNRRGQRFIDEASATVDEIYEDVARTIWRQEDQIAYFIGDQKINDLPGRDHAVLTDHQPYTADSIAELARQLGIDPAALEATVRTYNESTTPGTFDPYEPDGIHTQGLTPPKSNWAVPIDTPPFVAYPIVCSIVFTYGGIATSTTGEVLSADGHPIPGLYAVGECTGLYYRKYPGATSVMRGLVYGRLAGQHAAERILKSAAIAPRRRVESSFRVMGKKPC